jgi:hypothetical protein
MERNGIDMNGEEYDRVDDNIRESMILDEMK